MQITPAEARMVRYHAARLASRYRGMTVEDFEQEGYIALLEAKRDPDAGYEPKQVLTYLQTRVKGAMIDKMRRDVPGAGKRNQPVILCIDRFPERAFSAAQSQEGAIYRLELQSACRKAIDQLSIEEAHVIRRMFYAGCTTWDLVPEMGLCRSRILQLYRKALRRLRGKLNAVA